MAINNEIGVIQDLETISAICHEHGIIFHCDATQAAGKMDLNVDRLKVDLMSLSGHKVYGPKGIGAPTCAASPGAHRMPDSRRRP